MKNSFAVQYSVNLLLAALGLSGPLGMLVGLVLRVFLGEMLDRGLITLDIQIDKLKEAIKDPQWREAALKAYEKASSKVHTEGEKDAIRKEYTDALAAYATYGNGVLNDKNTKR